MKFQEAPVAQKFRSEGSDYDYQTAIDSGYDSVGTLPNIDSRTSMVLKGRNHKTWDLMVDEETELGNTIVKLDDGRYYSVKNQNFMSAPTLSTGDEDTQLNFAERAKRDYNFSMENNVEFGFGDAMRYEWGSLESLQKKIPFAGGMYKALENAELIATAQRIKNNTYEQAYWDEYAQIQHLWPEEIEDSLGTKEQFIERFKQQDKDSISAYIKYVTSEKTWMAKVATGVSALPTWFVEFAVTGGLASIGDDAVQKAGQKLIGEYAKTAIGKVAIRAVAIGAGGITRSVGLGHRIAEGMTQRQLDVIIGLKEEEGWAMSALISWGDVAIEAASEAAGEELTKGAGWLLKKTKFGSKVVSALEKSWITITGGTKGEFVRKMASKGGYSNILGEIGEERLGTILRAITNVDNFGAGKDANMIERLKFGIIQDYENIGVELGVLATPFIGQAVLGRIANIGKPADYFTDKFDQPEPFEPEPSPEVVADITTEPPPEAPAVAPVAEKPTGVQIIPPKAAEAPSINVFVGKDTGKVYPDESKLKQRTDPVTKNTELYDPETGEVMLSLKESQEAMKAEGVIKEVKKKPVEEETIAIKDANTDKDIDSIANTLITGKGDSQSTSARQADLQADREALGLDVVASAERKGWQKDLQDAYSQQIPDNALRIASEVTGNPRALNTTESAGLVIKAARLKNEHKSIMRKISETEDPAGIASLETMRTRIKNEFDILTAALYQSGSERGRDLASQKLTIDQDYDLLSLLSRAKARKGKPLTEKETKKIEQLSKDLEVASAQNELLQKKVNDLMAKNEIKRGSVSRYSGMSRVKIDFELDSLISRTRQLLDEGCYS